MGEELGQVEVVWPAAVADAPRSADGCQVIESSGGTGRMGGMATGRRVSDRPAEDGHGERLGVGSRVTGEALVHHVVAGLVALCLSLAVGAMLCPKRAAGLPEPHARPASPRLSTIRPRWWPHLRSPPGRALRRAAPEPQAHIAGLWTNT